jgi:hypothetical protein
MGMTNAEKQAAYRERYAANKVRVAELEAEVARLKARIAELERVGTERRKAKPEPAPKPSVAEKLKQARRNWQWMPEREIEECIRLARTIMVDSHPDKGGSHEAAVEANAELAFWKERQKLRRERERKAAEETAQRSARSKAAWAKRRAQQV